MQKCSLCGGKVVDGRCEDCGMPIPPEDRYTLRGEDVHTHEVNGEKVLHRQRRAPGKKPFYLCGEKGERRSPQRPAPRPAQSRPERKNPLLQTGNRTGKGKPGSLIWAFVILAVLLVLLPDLLLSLSA